MLALRAKALYYVKRGIQRLQPLLTYTANSQGCPSGIEVLERIVEVNMTAKILLAL